LLAGKTYDFVLPQLMVEWKTDDFGVELGAMRPQFSSRLMQFKSALTYI
jgi:hypothetical protein